MAVLFCSSVCVSVSKSARVVALSRARVGLAPGHGNDNNTGSHPNEHVHPHHLGMNTSECAHLASSHAQCFAHRCDVWVEPLSVDMAIWQPHKELDSITPSDLFTVHQGHRKQI